MGIRKRCRTLSLQQVLHRQIVVGSLNPLSSPTSPGVPAGAIPGFIYSLTIGQPGFYLLLPVIATIVVFLIVVYAESMRVEIPLSYGGVKGARGKYPLKFIYASNMPVILTSALLLNVQLFAAMFQKLGFPILGTVTNGKAVNGLAYILTPPNSLEYTTYRSIAGLHIRCCVHSSMYTVRCTYG